MHACVYKQRACYNYCNQATSCTFDINSHSYNTATRNCTESPRALNAIYM